MRMMRILHIWNQMIVSVRLMKGALGVVLPQGVKRRGWGVITVRLGGTSGVPAKTSLLICHTTSLFVMTVCMLCQ